MRKHNVKNARYVVKVQSMKGDNHIETLEIYDTKLERQIDFKTDKPSLSWFLNVSDLKESLNWCLNCYSEKMGIVWANTSNSSHGTVYLVD